MDGAYDRETIKIERTITNSNIYNGIAKCSAISNTVQNIILKQQYLLLRTLFIGMNYKTSLALEIV